MTNILDRDNHLVLSRTTDLGKTYEIGYPKQQGYAAASLADELAHGPTTPPGYQALCWEPGGLGYTSPGAENIGIVNGYVSHDRGAIYSYRINFYNSKGWHFKFIDESGDVYAITTIRNGWHYIDYNSDKPIICGVS
ncbi:hypothetical protein [Paracoccus binzhouensis]|uniref:hypothetical protein n=1 Tax=Paracoccus binzhouensis TaxID=2796149 RepID=UPI0018EF1F5E|nr:hypothetical protein [Paracoccus binzhouensis]